MPSSTFVSKPSTGRWALGLAALLIATFGLCRELLTRAFEPETFQGRAAAALKPSLQVLVLGSSRVFYGLNPALMDRPTMNLASGNLDLVSAERLYQLYEQRLPNLRLLVVEFSLATTFFDLRLASPDSAYGLGLRPDLDDVLTDPLLSLHRFLAPFFLWRIGPKRLGGLAGVGGEQWNAAAGYVPSSTVLIAPPEVVQTKLRSTQELLARMPPGTAARNLAALRRLVAAAQARRIQVLLLRFPKAGPSHQLYPPAWDERLAAARATLPDLPFVDLSRDPGFADGEFCDADHLNSVGAKRLTARLAATIGPLLQ